MRYYTFILIFFSLGLGGIALCTPAHAQVVSLFMPTATVVGYDPFEGLAGLQDITIEAQYSGDTPLAARLVITADTQSDFRFINSGQPLTFEINSAYGSSDTTRFDVPLNLTPSSTPQPITLTFKIPSGQYADYGDAEIDLKVTVVDSLTSEVISDEKRLTLVGRTPLRAQTNFAGTSAGYENGTTYAVVNFGEINGGESRRLNFQVRGNSDVDIAMSSENDGKMVNITAQGLSPIRYTVNADGVQSDLTVPLEFTRRPEKSLGGSSYPLTIMLDNMETGVFAGEYRDIISIDVTPR